MSKAHVMIDTEFMSRCVDSAIASIGAKVFDPLNPDYADGAEFYVRVDIENCGDLGLTIDAATVKWWLRQSAEVRLEVTSQDSTPLFYALKSLTEFVESELVPKDGLFLWCHAEVDASRLRNAYGLFNIEVPWKRRNVADLWTLQTLHKMRFGDKSEKPGYADGAHNALEDAKYQAKWAAKMYSELSKRGHAVTDKNDEVNHPAHYTDHPSGAECIDFTTFMNFNLGNAFRYMWRAGLKGPEVTDLNKALFYLNEELARVTSYREPVGLVPDKFSELPEVLDHWGQVRRVAMINTAMANHDNTKVSLNYAIQFIKIEIGGVLVPKSEQTKVIVAGESTFTKEEIVKLVSDVLDNTEVDVD